MPYPASLRLDLGNGSYLEAGPDLVESLRAQLSVPAPTSSGAVDSAEAARLTGMSTEYVRDHAAELGGVKHGNVWRFDPAKLEPAKPESQAPPRRRPARKAGLLDIKGKRV